MWQKERLLNVALSHLPDECKFIVWLDCDVVFERDDWLAATEEALQHSALIQPYSRVYDLQEGAQVSVVKTSEALLERPSMGSKYCDGSLDHAGTSTSMLGQHSPGHAWAVRRDAVEQTGLYDAMIIGSGDFAIAMAALGRHDEIVESYGMNPRQARHYVEWSRKWYRAVGGTIGVVEGELYHLWHGRLEDRGYDRRYASLQQFDFDPYTDVELDGKRLLALVYGQTEAA